MICVFDVIEGPARGKRFWLRQDERVEIGRISTADFSVPADHHMSRHHLIVEATVESFRVRDVGSANGTFVNDARVAALQLCSGDKIRAGSSTFKVSLIADDASPHAADGLSLDSSVAVKRASASVAQRAEANFEPDFQSGGNVAAPQRSVQIAQPVADLLASDEEVTQKLYSVDRLLDSVAKLSNSASVSSATAGGRSHFSNVDDRATELQSSTWVADYFEPTKVPQLFQQVEDLAARDIDLVDLLQMLDSEYRLTVVVNTKLLDTAAMKVIDNWRKLSRVMDLSPKLCLLTSDGSDQFWSLIHDSLRHEAIIVFGSYEPLKTAWLQHVADLLLSPTALNELLIGSTESLRAELLDQAAFVMFEQDRLGRLVLLARVQ